MLLLTSVDVDADALPSAKDEAAVTAVEAAAAEVLEPVAGRAVAAEPAVLKACVRVCTLEDCARRRGLRWATLCTSSFFPFVTTTLAAVASVTKPAAVVRTLVDGRGRVLARA